MDTENGDDKRLTIRYDKCLIKKKINKELTQTTIHLKHWKSDIILKNLKHQTTITHYAVRCCRFDALEQSDTRHYCLCVTDIILPETENFFVSYIISMTTFYSGP